MSYYDDSSLFLSPNGYKTSVLFAQKPMDANGQLAFTRSNDTATRVNSAGLIEKVRTNRVLQSQTLSVSPTWTAYSGTTVTADAIAAPDGTLTADRIAGTSAAFRGIFQTISSSAVPHTFSVYLKSATGSATTARIWVDSGVSLVNVTTDWQRFSVTATTAASFDVQISTAVSSAIDVYAWGAQLETGDIATDYIPTTTAAVSVGPVANLPRIDYTGGGCGKLLLEPQRTNSATYSESFNNAAWTKTQSTITANAVISPDGYTNADKLVEGSGSVQPTVLVNFGVLTTTLSQSIYAKAGERSVLALGSNTTDNTNAYAIFDLTNGVCKALTSAKLASFSITSVGNGWYRCTVNFIASTSTAGHRFVIAVGNDYNASFSSGLSPLPAYTGNGTSGIYIWGAQLEAGSYATSYIPTLGASVTRGADACVKTGISSLIGQTEGTLFVETTYNGAANSSQFNRIINITDGSLDNFIAVSKNSGTAQLYVYSQAGGAAQVDSSAIANTNLIGTHKIALAYKANDFVLYVDGVQRFTDTSGLVAACSQLNIGGIGALGGGADQLGGSVNQALLFKTRLSNSELAQLTTI